MHFYKKAIHVFVILFFSISIAFLMNKLLSPLIWSEINNIWLYFENYSRSSNKIFVVKIDSKTMQRLQKTDMKILNFSKKVYVDLIEKLQSSWAKAIWFDIVFANISEDNNILKEAFDKYKNIVIAATIPNSKWQEMILPQEIFSNATWWVITPTPTKNVLDKLVPQYEYNWKKYETLSIALYRKYLWTSDMIWRYNWQYYEINPLRKVPLFWDWNKNYAYMNFFNPPNWYPSASLIDVLDWKVSKDKIEWKIILIWEHWTLIHDEFISPVDHAKKMPWVEFHANMIDTILKDKFLIKQSQISKNITLGLLMVLLTIFYFYFPIKANIPIFFSYFVIVLLVWRLIFAKYEYVIDIFLYYIYWLTVFIVAYSYKYFTVDKDRRHIENAFSHYLSKEVVDMIANDKDSLKLWWEKRKVTIFFSDIVWFTTMSEMLWTEKIFSLLWEYLSEMTDILLKNKWTLDKYIWDAVMGFFNAPVIIERPEFMACKTALESQERLTILNEKWKWLGLPPLQMRIWINSWDAMVWNIWSKERFNYTVIWDNVNLASRLEAVNKEYLTSNIVSEETYLAVKDEFYFRELDTIKVKWKTERIKIYELLWYKDDTKVDREKISKYEIGLHLYYSWEYEKAKKIFFLNKWDKPSAIMYIRCQEIIDWKVEVINGVYSMKSK